MFEGEPPRVDFAEVAEQLGLDRAAAPNQPMRALQQLVVGKTCERVVHEVTSRDRRGEIAREHTMDFGSFRSGTQSGDRPSEFFKFAIEKKYAHAQISQPRGPKVRTTVTRGKLAAKTCQALGPDFSKKSVGIRTGPVRLSSKPVRSTHVTRSPATPSLRQAPLETPKTPLYFAAAPPFMNERRGRPEVPVFSNAQVSTETG